MKKKFQSIGSDTVYCFGLFRLFPERQLLLLRNQPVKLGGRSFELLRLLVQRRGSLVRKEELVAAAWPNTFVHESNLKVNINSLRRSLGDVLTSPVYIATVSGQGYRFVAPVEIGQSELDGEGIGTVFGDMAELPPQQDIVGRDSVIAGLLANVRENVHVTLVGAGGVGKTTIAVAAARALEADYPDGVCFVDLSTTDNPALVPVALAGALGLRGDHGDPLGAAIAYIEQRRMLVVLDNCEHVLPAATILARGLAAGRGGCRLLATSREPLGTAAEHIVWIDALACPEAGAHLTAAQALGFPAVELFVRRAFECAGYEFVDSDCDAVVQISRAVDGLPLALELVAAKMEKCTPQELLSMLDGHLGFHHPLPRGPSHRHETLLATIEWSFRLLSPTESMIFRLTSVFADAFELDDIAAIAVVAGLRPAQVTAGLGGLVAKSLVVAEVNGTGLSYRLLDSTRRFAAARRHEDPIDDAALRGHARRILALLRQSEEECEWRKVQDWLSRYRRCLPDLRAALSWAFGPGHAPEIGIQLAAAAIPLWSEVSLLSESQQWVALAFEAAAKSPCDDLLRAKLACSRGWGLFYARKLPHENEDVWRAAITYATSAGSADYHMRALLGLSYYLLQSGQIARAIDRLEELRALSRQHPAWSGIPDGERALAWARAHAGNLTESWEVLARQAKAYGRPDRRTRIAELDVDRYISTRFYSPIVAWLVGQTDYAATLAEDGIVGSASARHLVSQANVLCLGALPVALYRGDLDVLGNCVRQLRSILHSEHIARWGPVLRFFAAAERDLNGDRDAVQDMADAVDELIECRFLMRIGAYLAHLADVLAQQGRLAEADKTIGRALRYQEQQQERWCRPELLRVKASILRRSGRRSEAERLLQSALLEARTIGAVSFELRVANDLSGHYLEDGRGEEAMALLTPLIAFFSANAATRDVTVAAELLGRAGRGVRNSRAS
jgi:predicted ATPase/DNA-binding winged helix-turn-helix (wHTH) protein